MSDEGRAGGSGILPGNMKVLILANGFTAFPQPSGGMKHFLKLAEHWLMEGQVLSVMTTVTGRRNCIAEGFSGPFLLLPGTIADHLPIAAMYLLRAFKAVFHLPWHSGQHLLYGSSDMICDVFPAFIFRSIKRRSSLWVNCVFHLIPSPRSRAGSRLMNYLSHLGQGVSLFLIKQRADVIIVDNEMLKDQLLRKEVAPGRLLIAEMGTDIPPNEAIEGLHYDACFLGRLHRSKGVFDLVRIWGKVCEVKNGSTLAIVGTGPVTIMTELRNEIARHGLEDSIELLGYVTPEMLDGILSSCEVFVFPSYEEGFGISILEAMAHGLPVVTYELPHYRTIFDDVPAYVPSGDTMVFSDAVLGLLEDDDLRTEKARLSESLASRYSWAETSLREARAIVSRLSSGAGRDR
jgi:glycosyltransferase involved in cell wall biosynthesis